MESAQIEHVQPELQFWLRWVLANAVGFGIGWTLLLPLFFAPENFGSPSNSLVDLLPTLGWALVGLAIGLAQWIALRQLLKDNWWVIANIASWVFGWVCQPYISSDLDWRTLFLIAATVVGLLQWITLRRHVRQASVWVLANMAGWGAGALILIFMSDLDLPMRIVPGSISWPGRDAIAAGIWSGILTVLVLVWLRRYVRRAEVGVLICIAGCGAGIVLMVALETLLGIADSSTVGSLATLLWEGLAGIIVGAASGILTGLVLVWLLRHPSLTILPAP